MPELRYIPPEESAQRHRASPPQQGARAPMPRRPSQQRNIEAVLSLGDVRFFMSRFGVFCVPPVRYKLGQRVLNMHAMALQLAQQVVISVSKQSTDEYYRELQKIAKLLWKHIRPVHKVKRMFWRLGLLHNPFRQASEGEIREITDFFLQGRMTSSVRSMSAAEVLQ